jgi:transposase
MTDHIQGLPRNQTFLLPNTIEQYVAKDSPVKFIDAYINKLDMEKLGFTHAAQQENGAPSYDPKDLAKLYLYGNLNHVRSSRKLERECLLNMETMWLMKGLKPDFKTIADFRRDNAKAIIALFKDFVAFLKDLTLIGAQQITVDGTKLKAVNSIDRDFNQKTLAKRIKLIEKSVTRYLEELDTQDLQEAADEEQATTEAKEQSEAFRVDKLAALLEKKEKCKELLDKMQKSGLQEVALTDPECRLMKNRGKVEPCYNVQAAVDVKNHLIVDYKVTNEASDINQLSEVAVSAKQTLDVERLDAITDKGYFDSLQIKRCIDNGVVPYVAVKKCSAGPGQSGVPSSEFTADKFTYDEGSDVYVCPGGQHLLFYSSTVRRGMDMRVYRCREGVCCSCEFFLTKCTKNKLGRVIWRWVHQEVIDEMKERLRLHPQIMDERKEVAEHPFGTIKRAFGASYLLLKGLRKVSGEVGLLMMAYNLRRALNILGVECLMQAL